MKKVNSKVVLNKLKLRNLSNAQVRALEKTGEALHTKIVQSQTVPFDTGSLQNENFFVDYSKSDSGTVRLVFSTPYARRLYFHPEYEYSKEENPKAGGKWMDDYINGSKRNYVVKTYREFFKKGSGLK